MLNNSKATESKSFFFTKFTLDLNYSLRDVEKLLLWF